MSDKPPTTFLSKLLAATRRQNSLLCVGLDPQPEMMPIGNVFEFNRAIIDATKDLVCAYKPNLAFYEALGTDGLVALKRTVEYIPEDIPIIGDAKRSDIGNTAAAYAKGLFVYFGFDAVTVNPYLGYDSVSPFLEYHDKGVFILCRTSNPGAKDFQDFQDSQGQALYQRVALKAKEWATITSPPSPSPSTERGLEGEVDRWHTPAALWEGLKPIARQMRKEPTEAEDLLWQRIRNQKLSEFKFRRQHSIERFIVDFYCSQAKLVVEIDGPIHQYQQEEDEIRQTYLESQDLRVLRFSNDEVLNDVKKVLQRITEALTSPLYSPSPSTERGLGGEVVTTKGNIGLVVGATYPEEIKWVRQNCTEMPLLIPGIGPQGGDLEKAVRYSVDSKGERSIIVSARQVLYASKGKDFAQAARQAALKLRDEINRYRGT
ncbi:MAG: orotidine 5'-phosphate decarboxylase [Dehalococcoidia bacterium]|nr:orotidine 5'-phosphate decarboxylase [Dehalococcoidia bacterium]